MNAWDAARHGERRQAEAAIAVCEIFLREPDGWEVNGEFPVLLTQAFSRTAPLLPPLLWALGMHVEGYAQMLCPDNVFFSHVYGQARLNTVWSCINSLK